MNSTSLVFFNQLSSKQKKYRKYFEKCHTIPYGKMCTMPYFNYVADTCQTALSLVPLQSCKVVSTTMITCPSHASSQSKQTSVQFFLNGVLYTGDSPSSLDSGTEEEEEEPHKGHFLLEYVEDPQFFTANKEKLIKHHPGEPLTLIINVSDTSETWRLD